MTKFRAMRPVASLSVQAKRRPERQAAGGKAGGGRERRRSAAWTLSLAFSAGRTG